MLTRVPDPLAWRGYASRVSEEMRPASAAAATESLARALHEVSIAKSSPLPYYHQVKQALVASMISSGLEPGDRIPGDHQLCEHFRVSRSVVRQALSELEVEGVIERVKGRGTFVAMPKTTEGLVRSTQGLYDEVLARGSTIVSDVLRQEIVPADEFQAEELEVAPGSDLVMIERLRRVDGEPWVHTTAYLPAHKVPGLTGVDLRETSLYAHLRAEHGLVASSALRSVEAALASVRSARLLGLSAGAPVLVLRSVARGADDAPFESFVAYHRGDRSRFDVELEGEREVSRVSPVSFPRTRRSA